MVCDWNLRAWTFLEAFRGRDNVQILCKGDVIVSLKESVEMVYRSESNCCQFNWGLVPDGMPPARFSARQWTGELRGSGVILVGFTAHFCSSEIFISAPLASARV